MPTLCDKKTVPHVLDKAWLAVVLHTVHWRGKSQSCPVGHVFGGEPYLTRDVVDDACIPPHIAVAKPKPAPKPAPKGDAKGKKKSHVHEFTMRCSLTKKGLIAEPVDP